MLFYERVSTGTHSVSIVVYRVFLVVILVALFRNPELAGEGQYPCYNGFVKGTGFFQLCFAGFCCLLFFFVAIENYRAILLTYIVELSIVLSWIDVSPEYFQKLFVADFAGVVGTITGLNLPDGATMGDVIKNVVENLAIFV